MDDHSITSILADAVYCRSALATLPPGRAKLKPLCKQAPLDAERLDCLLGCHCVTLLGQWIETEICSNIRIGTAAIISTTRNSTEAAYRYPDAGMPRI